jgi:hypothetical protein
MGRRINGKTDMTKKKDDGFTIRTISLLASGVVLQDWEQVEICAGVLAREHGICLPEPLRTKMARAFAEHAN